MQRANIKILVLPLILLLGCDLAEKHANGYQITPQIHTITEAAKSTDWLKILGAVTIAFGIAAFINGSSRATGVIAAGIALITISLLVTTYMCLLEQYHTVFMYTLLALGIVSFFTFFHTAADINRDGRIDTADLLALARKIFGWKNEPIKK